RPSGALRVRRHAAMVVDTTAGLTDRGDRSDEERRVREHVHPYVWCRHRGAAAGLVIRGRRPAGLERAGLSVHFAAGWEADGDRRAITQAVALLSPSRLGPAWLP